MALYCIVTGRVGYHNNVAACQGKTVISLSSINLFRSRMTRIHKALSNQLFGPQRESSDHSFSCVPCFIRSITWKCDSKICCFCLTNAYLEHITAYLYIHWSNNTSSYIAIPFDPCRPLHFGQWIIEKHAVFPWNLKRASGNLRRGLAKSFERIINFFVGKLSEGSRYIFK